MFWFVILFFLRSPRTTVPAEALRCLPACPSGGAGVFAIGVSADTQSQPWSVTCQTG